MRGQHSSSRENVGAFNIMWRIYLQNYICNNMPFSMKLGEKPGLVVTAFGKTTARPCKSSWHTSSTSRRENRTAVHLSKRIVCDTASVASKKRQSLKKDKPPPLPTVSKFTSLIIKITLCI